MKNSLSSPRKQGSRNLKSRLKCAGITGSYIEPGIWQSKSPADTIRIAGSFANQLRRGDIVGLIGPLGSGKTLFIKGLCEALGIPSQEVLSPTFTLIHRYEGSMSVHHFDAYRLEDKQEFEDLGYEEQFFGDGISLVEWADKVLEFLPPGSRILEFKITGLTQRQITHRIK